MKGNIALKVAAFVVVGAAFFWMLTRLDWKEFGNRILGASPVDLGLMLLFWMLALLLRPIRFRFLLNVLSQVRRADYRTVWAALLLGNTVNSFMPLRVGDVVLALFLRQRLGIGIHETAMVIIADWACDFLCVAAIFLGALAFAPVTATWTSHAIVILAVAFIAGGAGVLVVIRCRARALWILDLILSRLAPKWQTRAYQIAKETLDGLAAIATWRVALPLILLSVLIWSVIGLSYWFGLRAVFPDSSPVAALFSMAAVTLSFVVPLGPGGMGAFEAAAIGALSLFRVPIEAALAFAILAHSFQLLVILLFTVMAVFLQRIDYRSLWAAAKKD